MSDERFARQYRFELPSGFPLTSPCTSIVHHLSGPSMHAPARHRPGGQRAACLAPGKRLGQSRVTCALGFATQTLAHMLDSLVRVSRRVGTLRYLDLGHVKPVARYAWHREHRRRSTPYFHAAEPRAGSRRFLNPPQAMGTPHSQGTKSLLPSDALF